MIAERLKAITDMLVNEAATLTEFYPDIFAITLIITAAVAVAIGVF